MINTGYVFIILPIIIKINKYWWVFTWIINRVKEKINITIMALLSYEVLWEYRNW